MALRDELKKLLEGHKTECRRKQAKKESGEDNYAKQLIPNVEDKMKNAAKKGENELIYGVCNRDEDRDNLNALMRVLKKDERFSGFKIQVITEQRYQDYYGDKLYSNVYYLRIKW